MSGREVSDRNPPGGRTVLAVKPSFRFFRGRKETGTPLVMANGRSKRAPELRDDLLGT
jgi:hypothetical protein